MDKQLVAKNALAAMADEEDRRGARKRSSELAHRSWHLVQIGGRSRKLAERHLEDSGYQIYTPMLRTMVRPPARSVSKAQRKLLHLMQREKIEPFFRGYSFVHFNVKTDPWHDIFKLVGVYGISCENNMPKVMPAALVDGLRSLELNGAIPGDTPVEQLLFQIGDRSRLASAAFVADDRPVEERFKVGDLAKVVDGPFIGFKGPVEKVDDEGRISLLLTFLGSARTVSVDVDELVPAPATP